MYPALSLLRRFALCALTFLVVSGVRAEIAVNITYLDSSGEGFYDNTPRAAAPGNAGTTLGAQRRNAFEAAVYHWSKLLNGNVPLRIQASWVAQGVGTLASASPLGYVSDWNGVPVTGRYYPIALANQLAGLDHDPTTDDIRVFCNPDFDNGIAADLGDPRKWYYGTDGGAPGDDFDFYSTILHELGHGLGFISFLNTNGSWVNGAPTIYDNFLVNGSGNWVSSLSQSQRAAIVTGANLFSAGGWTTSANYDQWARIHAPTTFKPGSSLSHLDENTYSTTGSIDECMTPTSSFATHNIGPVAIGLYRDMGYSFVDNQAPSVTISHPANGSSRSDLLAASGTVTDNSSAGTAGASGVREVRVTLWRQAGGNWYDWTINNWGGTTYNHHLHVRKAFSNIIPIGKGTRSWAIDLPTLPDGNYEIQVQAVDQMNLGSAWLKSSFTIDKSDPAIAFDPLQENDVVFNFANIGGTVAGADIVSYAIYDTTDVNLRFWNGSAWVTSGEAYLPATISGGRWAPADADQLPPRSALRLGSYRVIAKARDNAGNQMLATINVTRSAADTTFPEVLIVTPETNQVFTVRSLPIFSGLAEDPESGIENVSVYLVRFADDGILYWDGVGWSSVSTPLQVMVDKVGGSWQSTGILPSGEDLPNGIYQVQVTVQNGENPPATRGAGINFTVDYHPTYTWTEGSYVDGVVGNENHDFTNPANWSPYGVPPADAIAVIQKGHCNGPTNATIAIYGINLGSGATFNFPALFVKKLNMTSGYLNGGTVHLNGDGGVFNWTAGQIKGEFSIQEGAVANISGSSDKTLGSGTVFNNYGTVNWSGSGSFYNHGYNPADPATVNNARGAVFNLLTDGTLFSSSYTASTFNNLSGALFVKTGGGGSTIADSFDFNNQGEVRSDTGSLVFSSKLNAADGSKFSGAGKIVIRTGTFHFAGDLLLDSITFEQTSGSLTGASNFRINMVNGARFNWTVGSLSGAMEIAPGGVVNVSGSSDKYLSPETIIRNRGTFNWAGSGDFYTSAYALTNRSTFHNMSGAVLNITGGADFEYSYNPSTFINDAGATVHKTAGTSTDFKWVFHNSGTVRCDSATLSMSGGGNHAGTFFASGGAFVKFAGATHRFENETVWNGTGTFQVSSSGTALVNGTLQLGQPGSFTGVELHPGGTLLGEAGLLTGYASMQWTGGALGGQLLFDTNLTVQISGSSTKSFSSGAVIDNRGVFNWDGSGELYASAYDLTNRVTFNNLSNAIFNIQSNSTFSASYNASIFNNHPGATVIKSRGGEGGNKTTRLDWVFNSPGTVRATSGTLNLAAGGESGGIFNTESNGIIRFGGGTHLLADDTILNGAGKIQIASSVHHHGDVHSGTAEIPATLEILPGGSFSGSGALTGTAAVHWTGGQVGRGVLDVAPGISFLVSGSSQKTFGDPTVFNNSGTFVHDGTGSLYCSAYFETNSAVFNNLSGGVFKVVNDGDIFSTSYNPSHFTNHPGGIIIKEGGTGTTTLNDFKFYNASEVRVQTGTLTFGSTLDLNPGSRFTGTGAVRLSGDVKLTGTLDSEIPVSLVSGKLTGVADAVLNGSGGYSWSVGQLSGVLTINPNVTLTVSGSSEKSFSDTTILTNLGKVVYGGTGNLYVFAYTTTNRSFIYNESGAVWEWDTDADLTYSSTPSVFVNESGATFRKMGGTSSTVCNWAFENRGNIEVVAGNLSFPTSITMEPGASTKLFLGGTTATSGYSQLLRSGALPVAGSLELAFKNDFVPTNGASFNLVTYTSRTGQFAPVILPGLPAESTWALSYESNALVARVVPVTFIHNAARMVDGSFQFSVTGDNASSAVVEISSDLVNWMPLSTNAPFNGALTINDPVQEGSGKRFYRVLLVK